MSIVIDKILGQPLSHDHPVKLVVTDPTTAKEGTQIFNTSDNSLKIYYGGYWWPITDISPFVIQDESGQALRTENNNVLLVE
jgi:hypothetical protein